MTGAPRVLVVGGGGREHALVWALHESPQHPLLYAAPGNPGMEPWAERIPLAADDLPGLLRWARAERPDLVVVGPEIPLSLGLADLLRDSGIAVLGPGRAASRLEWSKVYAKETMRRLGIPSADFVVVRAPDEARRVLDASPYPAVLKADGLAAGKGVVIARDREEAERVVEAWMVRGALGASGRALVIERCLAGTEVSILVLTDGERWMLFPAARDHKRVGDGDTGPNTGGMGACAPAPAPAPEDAVAMARRVVDPLLAELRAAAAPFRGVLYLGMMLTAEGPQVLEFNVRFGDPEAQAVLPLLEEDPVALFLAAARGALPPERHGMFVTHAGAAVCVVLAARGYPDASETGVIIEGLDRAWPHGIRVYHSGVDRRGGQWVTSGGRVLGVTARAESLGGAREAAYAAAAAIRFPGVHYRRDIAAPPESPKGSVPR